MRGGGMKKWSGGEALGFAALGGMGALWVGFACWVIRHGGFFASHAGSRRSQAPYEDRFFRVEGWPAALVACVFLALGAIALALILKRCGVSPPARALAALAIMAAPWAWSALV